MKSLGASYGVIWQIRCENIGSPHVPRSSGSESNVQRMLLMAAIPRLAYARSEVKAPRHRCHQTRGSVQEPYLLGLYVFRQALGVLYSRTSVRDESSDRTSASAGHNAFLPTCFGTSNSLTEISTQSYCMCCSLPAQRGLEL